MRSKDSIVLGWEKTHLERREGIKCYVLKYGDICHVSHDHYLIYSLSFNPAITVDPAPAPAPFPAAAPSKSQIAGTI